MKKVDCLDGYSLLNWRKASETIFHLEEDIRERIDYIVFTIFNTYGEKIESWSFPDAKESGETGSLYSGYCGNKITIVIDRVFGCKELQSKLVILNQIFGERIFHLHESPTTPRFELSFPDYWIHLDFETDLLKSKKLSDKKQKITRILNSNHNLDEEIYDLLTEMQKDLK